MLDSRPLEDPAEIRVAQSRRRSDSLRWVLGGIVLLMVGMSLVDHLLAPPGESRSFISLSMGGVALLSYLLLRAHPRKWGSPLMVVGILVTTAWAVYSYGSVRAASSLALLGAVVMAGTYLSLRALWATTLSGMLILGGLTWAEAGGHLVQPGLAADLRYWLMGSVIMVVIGALLHHTRKATDEAYLRQLNQSEDRLRLEHERDQSQRRFQRIFRLNPTALMIQFAGTGSILEVNPAFERGFGFPCDQLVGQPAGRLWADVSQWQAHSRRLFERGRTEWQHSEWLRSDGQVTEVLVCSELSEDPSGTLILTTVLPDVAGTHAAVSNPPAGP
jgi:PAS domain S-box-containing protein